MEVNMLTPKTLEKNPLYFRKADIQLQKGIF